MIAAPVRIVEQEDIAGADRTLESGLDRAHREGSAPTWMGTCSAWAIKRPAGSASAVEKSREELRICE